MIFFIQGLRNFRIFPVKLADIEEDERGGGYNAFHVDLEDLTLSTTDWNQDGKRLPLEVVDRHLDEDNALPIRAMEPGYASVALSPTHLIVARTDALYFYVNGYLSSTLSIPSVTKFKKIDFITTFFEEKRLVPLVATDTTSVLVVLLVKDEQLSISHHSPLHAIFFVVPWGENKIALWDSSKFKTVEILNSGSLGKSKEWTFKGSTKLQNLPHHNVDTASEKKGRLYMRDDDNLYCLQSEKMCETENYINVKEWSLNLGQSLPSHVIPEVLVHENNTMLYWIEKKRSFLFSVLEFTQGSPIHLHQNTRINPYGSTMKVFSKLVLLPEPIWPPKTKTPVQILAIDNLPGCFIARTATTAFLLDVKSDRLTEIGEDDFTAGFSFPFSQGILRRNFEKPVDWLTSLRLWKVSMSWDPLTACLLPTPVREALKLILMTQKFRPESEWSKVPTEILNKIFDLAVANW